MTARLERDQVGVATLTGQLTDAETGTPIANERVELYDSFSGQQVRTAFTGNGGVYEITEILTGTYQVRFGGNTTYVPEWFDNQPTQDTAAGVTLAGTEPTVIDAALVRGGSLQVVVRAADTQFLLPNVAVTARNVATGGTAFSPTGSDGFARFNGLAPGEYAITTSAAGEYLAQSDAVTATIVSEQRTRVNIALQRGARLIGQVLDAQDGTPLAGVSVALYDAGVETVLPGFRITDAQGRYEIPGVVPGDYKVRFRRFGYLTEFANNSATWTNADTVAISGTTSLNADLLRDVQVGALIGTVTLDPTGVPARSATVALYDALSKDQLQATSTDNRGEYRFTSVPSGTYLVRFVPPTTSGYAIEWFDNQFRIDQATPISVTTNQVATANAVLSPAPSRIAGRVTAADTGDPLAGVQVGVFIQATGERVGVRTTNAQGVYTVTGLISGTYVVEAQPPFGSSYARQWFDGKRSRLTADPVTTTATLTGTADFALQITTLTGRVVDRAGQPVPGASINVFGASDSFSTRTTATGAYTVTGVAAGEYIVLANPTTEQRELFGFIPTYHPDATSQEEATRVVVPISGTVRADVTMQPGVDFTAVVVDETTQEPLGGMRVNLLGVGQQISDASGQVRFEKIAPRSDYTIRIDPPTLGPLTRYPTQWYDRVNRIELADPVVITATTSLTIPLSTEPIQARATLEGVVLAASDPTTPTLAAVALPDVQVELYRLGDQRPVASTTTNDSGAFSFVDVFPGSYVAYFRTPTFGPASRFASQWFDGVATRTQARPLTLQLGETTRITATLAARPVDTFVTPAARGIPRSPVGMGASSCSSPQEPSPIP